VVAGLKKEKLYGWSMVGTEGGEAGTLSPHQFVTTPPKGRPALVKGGGLLAYVEEGRTHSERKKKREAALRAGNF